MIEHYENRGLEEVPEQEGTRAEFSKKSKIKYTRALLFELTEVEVCKNLPSDFDLIILRQLDGVTDTMVEPEHKGMIGKPFDHGMSPKTTWNLALPGEKWGNHLYTPSTESHLQINCGLDRKDMSKLLPHKFVEDAEIVHSEIQRSYPFQLIKTENPYRPPHRNKKILPPVETFYEPGVESLDESDHKGAANDIAGQDKSVYYFTRADDNYLIKTNEGNEMNEPSEPVDDFEEFWRKNEGNEIIVINRSLEGLMEDNQTTFDDFWTEILETIHSQQAPDTSPVTSHSDSEVKIPFPDEQSLAWVPENLNSLNLDAINLPDEDSLISIDDMIFPHMKNKAKSACSTELVDRSKSEAKTSTEFSRLPSYGQLQYHLPRDLLYDQTGFLPLFPTPNTLPLWPETYFPNTKTKGSVSHYSLSHQPNISPELLPHHLLLDTTCSDPKNRMSIYDVDTMQSCARLTSSNP